ncbi:hypothetical protein DPMN_021067 [Dreissena polymorpha]|uniref:Uncharacterized protein n=1 Tax=Dreissena polymorpha TaxID=45954 RepID=A0A9D4NHX7_DREPO|nr:hypothetical protein DPMN_021067 [Dreissena polymorpha]
MLDTIALRPRPMPEPELVTRASTRAHIGYQSLYQGPYWLPRPIPGPILVTRAYTRAHIGYQGLYQGPFW